MLKGFARAVAGGLLFSVPLLMTMEVWELAVAVDRWRLVLLSVAAVLLTLGLARTFGGEGWHTRWSTTAVDAGVAVLAGLVVSLGILILLNVVAPVESWRAAASVVTVEALPASLGAAFARGQLGQDSPDVDRSGYHHQLFLMLAGAVVFCSNLAPTEEMVLIAAFLTPVHALVLVLVSLVLAHGLVYGSGFAGEEEGGLISEFWRFTVPGYVIAFAASAFMLWTFGRFEGTGALVVATESAVLALPACLGAGAARLIL